MPLVRLSFGHILVHDVVGQQHALSFESAASADRRDLVAAKPLHSVAQGRFHDLSGNVAYGPGAFLSSVYSSLLLHVRTRQQD